MGKPLTKTRRATAKAVIEIVKLQFQPRFSSTHTITVEVMRPPVQREKKNQLKKADMARRSDWSSWSAPWAGKAALIPPTPIAIA